MRYVNFGHTSSGVSRVSFFRKVFYFLFRFRVHIFFVFIFFVLFFLSLLGYYAYSFFSGMHVSAGEIVKAPGAVVTYVAHKDPYIKHDDGRVNIALLGIGGQGHDGPYLTDTMIVASIHLVHGDVVLIAIPRDTWVSGTRSKLNAVYAYGREQGDKQGLAMVKHELGRITGLPIHYAVRIDFHGFVRAIDMLGGIDVVIDTSFSDPLYPIAGRERDMCGYREIEEKIASDSGELVVKKLVDSHGNEVPGGVHHFACRYETLVFHKGPAHFDGSTALKFVRSRHGTDNEGSDFARSRRQEKVIAAVKEKLFSADVLLNPSRVGSLLHDFGSSIETDIEPFEYGEFFKLFQRTRDGRIVSYSLSAEGADSLLIVPADITPYRGAYVLVPRAGSDDWSVIHQAIQTWLRLSFESDLEASGSAVLTSVP